MLSKPHFYQAEPVVSRFVPRFKPNYDADETMLDLEPVLLLFIYILIKLYHTL